MSRYTRDNKTAFRRLDFPLESTSLVDQLNGGNNGIRNQLGFSSRRRTKSKTRVLAAALALSEYQSNGDDAHFLSAGLIGLILPTALLLSYALKSLAWTEWLNTVAVVIVSLIGITALALPKSQAKYPKVPGPLIVFAAVTSILIAVISAYYKGLGDGWTLQ